jgi:hypothetical protein
LFFGVHPPGEEVEDHMTVGTVKFVYGHVRLLNPRHISDFGHRLF